MRPKGKLLTLFVMFVAIGLVTASGAFSSTSVDRAMAVSVADDSAALLGLAPNSSSPNGAYASVDAAGTINVTVDNVNIDATTDIDHVLNVTNNGQSTVTIWVTFSGGTNNSAVTLYEGSTAGTAIANTQGGSSFTLSPTNSASVSIRIDSAGDASGDTLVDTVTFHAAT
ncbi:MAG: hypothetical protein R3324_01915 [Halobacteriales archaeon]|nr:hypothetical protein [Halobacteriales archaeon]